MVASYAVRMTGAIFAASFLFAVVRVPSPISGVRRAVAPGALLAIPFVFTDGVQGSDLAVAWAGASLGSLALLVAGRGSTPLGVMVEGLSAAGALAPFWLVTVVGWDPADRGLLAVAGGVIWFGFDLLTRAAFDSAVSENFAQRLQRSITDPYSAALTATSGLLFGLIYPHSIFWALSAAGIPLLFVRQMFAGVSESRRAAEIAVEVLGSLPEGAGLVPAGHGEASTATARQIAVALRLPAGDIDEVVTAARLHELGAVRTADPSVREQGFSTADIGRWGADLLLASHRLHRTAELIRGAGEAYRVPGMAAENRAVGADIVRVACAYERLRRNGKSHREAVEDLHLASSLEFKQTVVEALWEVQP